MLVKQAGLPYVVAIAGTNSDIPIDPCILSGAMFGNLAVTITMQLDKANNDRKHDHQSVDRSTTFGSGGRRTRLCRRFRTGGRVRCFQMSEPLDGHSFSTSTTHTVGVPTSAVSRR